MQTRVRPFSDVYREEQYTFRSPLHEHFPFNWYKEMRASAPVFYDESLQAWSFFLYEDVDKALSDFSTFSSRTSLDDDPSDLESLIRTDPPLHRQLRSLISQVFTPRSIAALAPMVAQIVDETLQPLQEQGEVDVMQAVAYPIPVAVISRMLGVPMQDHVYLKPLIEQGFFERKPETLRVDPQGAGFLEVREYFRSLIAQRRRSPQHDLISDLIQAELNGEHLNDDQLISFCRTLYVAGHVTTTNLVGNALLCFDSYPDALAEVRADPGLLPGTVEEVLRCCGPVQSFLRLVARDVEVHGQQLHAGENLLLWNGSANYDERVFKDPERFDIRRSPNKHLAFGRGIHICIGAPLARLEAPIILGKLLERMQAIQIDRAVPLEPVLPRSFYGVKRLPISFASK